jgi:hypothetical protein
MEGWHSWQRAISKAEEPYPKETIYLGYCNDECKHMNFLARSSPRVLDQWQ